MPKTFDQIFADEVKRILKSKIASKNIQNVPLPKEAGGELDMETLRAYQTLQTSLGALDNYIVKKPLFGKAKPAMPDEITQEGYDTLSNIINTKGIPANFDQIIDELASKEQIGKHIATELGNQYNNAVAKAGKKPKPWYISGKELLMLHGIDEKVEYYKELEGELVWKPPKGVQIGKPVYDILKGDYKRDDYGDVVMESVGKPTGSIYICSKKSIKLPARYDAKRYGYAYANFYKDSNGQKVFIYAVPKQVVYKIDQLALVITKRTQMKAYEMVPYHTWTNGMVAICVIPYNPNEKYELHSTRVLATAYGNTVQGVYQKHFKDKVDKLINTWVQAKILGNPNDFTIENEWGDSRNLIVDESKTTLDKSTYKGISSVSMIEENEDKLRSEDAFQENELDEDTTASTNDDDWDNWDW